MKLYQKYEIQFQIQRVISMKIYNTAYKKIKDKNTQNKFVMKIPITIWALLRTQQTLRLGIFETMLEQKKKKGHILKMSLR